MRNWTQSAEYPSRDGKLLQNYLPWLLVVLSSILGVIQLLVPSGLQPNFESVIAALFNPLRLRIQDVIERRFYRRKHDAEKALVAFAAAARDEMDVDRFGKLFISLAGETMQPETVLLWMRVNLGHRTFDR